MSKSPYDPVKISQSPPGDVVSPPSDGEAFSCEISDGVGDYTRILIEWQGNEDAWISGDNYVSLSAQV